MGDAEMTHRWLASDAKIDLARRTAFKAIEVTAWVLPTLSVLSLV
jgi:hypothetical protein